jgi:hypothetical protein
MNYQPSKPNDDELLLVALPNLPKQAPKPLPNTPANTEVIALEQGIVRLLAAAAAVFGASPVVTPIPAPTVSRAEFYERIDALESKNRILVLMPGAPLERIAKNTERIQQLDLFGRCAFHLCDSILLLRNEGERLWVSHRLRPIGDSVFAIAMMALGKKSRAELPDLAALDALMLKTSEEFKANPHLSRYSLRLCRAAMVCMGTILELMQHIEVPSE